MWSTKKPAPDASNPIALNANLHGSSHQKNGLHGGTTADFDQGESSYQNAEVSFVACERPDNCAGLARRQFHMLCDTCISSITSVAAEGV